MPPLGLAHFQPRQCLFCRQLLPFSYSLRPFSSTSRQYNEATVPNHYETLGLPPHADAHEIKKSFYALSKRHHPDRNPGNPSSAKKFVQISEAYHVLSSPEGRSKYDRQYHMHHGTGRRHGGAGFFGGVPRGSHSSHTASGGSAGGRPASGLSRRRTQFRGPPPSFYRNGGWGAQGAKRERAQYASTTGSGDHHGTEDPSSSSSHTEGPDGARTAPGGTSAGGHGSGGFGPGQQTPGYDPDPTIPYWDKAGHFRTQEKLRGRNEATWRSKLERERSRSAYDEAYAGGSAPFKFVMVGGVVVAVIASASWTLGSREQRERKRVVGSNAVKRENG